MQPIGSEYEWRCFKCAAMATTERADASVALPAGWVWRNEQGATLVLCRRCKGGLL